MINQRCLKKTKINISYHERVNKRPVCPDVWINQLQWKRGNQITQLNGSARHPRRHARRATTSGSSTCCHFFMFIQSGKRAQMAPIEKERWRPLRSIQFGVRKMDGSVPKDTEFMSLEGFLVNREEKWKRVKMKTKWEEMPFMRPHAYMHAHTLGERCSVCSEVREIFQSIFSVSQMRISVQRPITFSVTNHL